MLQQQLVEKLIQVLDINFYHILISGIIIAVILMVLKIVIEGIAHWILFKMDSFVGIGTPVEVYGKTGRIKKANWSAIVVEFDEGYLRIPTKQWRASKYLIIKSKTATEEIAA